VTERVFVIPPGSQLGPITAEQRKALIDGSLVAGVYEKAVDRESAFEILRDRTASATPAKPGDALLRPERQAPSKPAPRTP
jgi:DNA helicase HerA-like ATPase